MDGNRCGTQFPLDIVVLPDLNAVLLQPSGPFSVDAALSWGPAVQQHPDTRPGMHHIVDLSLLQVTAASRHDVEALVGQFAARVQDTEIMMAYVAPSDLAFGMTRMFELISDVSRPRQRAVFRSLALAKTWIADQRGQDTHAP